MIAAHNAAEAALRLVKPGNQNFAVTDTVTKIAEVYKCKPVEGMLSFQLQQGRIDGEKTIIQNPTEAQRKEVEKHEFETHEVYGVDVIVSTGEGQVRSTFVLNFALKYTNVQLSQMMISSLSNVWISEP